VREYRVVVDRMQHFNWASGDRAPLAPIDSYNDYIMMRGEICSIEPRCWPNHVYLTHPAGVPVWDHGTLAPVADASSPDVQSEQCSLSGIVSREPDSSVSSGRSLRLEGDCGRMPRQQQSIAHTYPWLGL
jgi:hypothetical protein